MEARLQKWGNSNGIRIPNALLEDLKIKTNDKVNIEKQDDKIVISKVKSSKISLKDLFDKYNGENLSNDFSWDDPKGREIW